MRDNGAMQRRLAFVLAWIAVTGISVFVATQAVGTVRNQVTDTPATLPTVEADAAPATTSGSVPGPPTTVVVTTSTALPPQASTDGVSSTISPPTTPPEPAATSTTAAPTTTRAPTTTEPPPSLETATYELTGGWVRIQYGDGEVRLVDAAPYSGYSMTAEKTGPIEIEIEFEGPGYEGKFTADMEYGSLDVDIDEGGDEDEE